jgi:predicted RNA binding protein YcfA (HicA-like mRNA interferase family)
MRLPILSSRKVVRALKKAGFSPAPVRGKGSHIALYKIDDDGRKLLVIVPRTKGIPRGTLRAIIDQAGLTREQFLKLL